MDLFILETFRDLNEMGAAIAAVRSLCDLPIVAQMTIEDHGSTLDGTPPEKFGPELVRRGAHLVGVNCSVGPAPMLETIERIGAETDAPLSAQPNAGKPRHIEGRTIYLSSPEYMASYARRFIAKGVRLVGGCCGTTYEHIRQIKLAVGSASTAPARIGAAPPVSAAGCPATVMQPPLERERKSRLAHAMARGKFVCLVELTPPRGHEFLDDDRGSPGAEDPRGGRDQHPRLAAAAARMSAISIAVLIEQQAGIETVLHYACRDRNLLGMQSDLLGRPRDGSPQRAARHRRPAAPRRLRVCHRCLRRRLDRADQRREPPEPRDRRRRRGARPADGATTSAWRSTRPRSNLDDEMRRFEFKVEAGAEFAITQSVFDLEAFDAFLRRVEPLRMPILAGLWPFDSQLNAEFMANEVPGVRVPEPLLRRMQCAGSPEEAAAEGVAIAREMAVALKDRVQGFQLSNAGGRVGRVLEVLDGVL